MDKGTIECIDISVTENERGATLIPLDDNEVLKGRYYNLHISSLNPGAIRGNH